MLSSEIEYLVRFLVDCSVLPSAVKATQAHGPERAVLFDAKLVFFNPQTKNENIGPFQLSVNTGCPTE